MAVRFDAAGEAPLVTIPNVDAGFTIAGWAYMSVDRNDYSGVFCVDDNTEQENTDQ